MKLQTLYLIYQFNYDKLQVFLSDKRKTDLTDKRIKTENENVQVVSDVKMFWIHLDFNPNRQLLAQS